MSRSPSGSRSGSRSTTASSDSEQAPRAEERAPVGTTEAAERSAAQGDATTSNTNEYISLFIGLGPAARGVRQEDLFKFLKSNALDENQVVEVRLRGRCAFADIATDEEAQHLISKLDGTMFLDNVRLTVQVSHNKRDEKPRRDRERAHPPVEGPTSLFVGLGPNGVRVTNEDLLSLFQTVGPVRILTRRDQCAFIEASSYAQAEQIIQQFNSQHIGESRLSIQFSRDSRKRDRGEARRSDPLPAPSGRGGRRGDDRRRLDRRDRRSRSRSDSRDRRRRVARRRRYSDESRSSHDDRRRDRRDRRDRRHRRSRSYSSRSYSSRSYSSRSSSTSERPRRNDRRPPPSRR
eukprot:gene10138-7096_t